MNTTPSNDNGPETLAFSPFVTDDALGGEDVSVYKVKLRPLISRTSRGIKRAARSVQRRVASSAGVGQHSVCRYSVDLYGRPRKLTELEAVLYALAWPTIIGVVVGFGLAIALVVLHTSPVVKVQQQANSSTQQDASVESVL